jgi:hypothetical protein
MMQADRWQIKVQKQKWKFGHETEKQLARGRLYSPFEDETTQRRNKKAEGEMLSRGLLVSQPPKEWIPDISHHKALKKTSWKQPNG